MLGHEVDVIGRDLRRRHDEVAFVLTILVVRDDDHLALTDRFEGVFDPVELGVRHHGVHAGRGFAPRTSR